MNKYIIQSDSRTLASLLMAALLIILYPARSIVFADEQGSGANAHYSGQIVQAQIFTNLVKPLKSQDYEREIDIYLPAAYIADKARNIRFPVIYLLHGSPGNPYDFTKHGYFQESVEDISRADNFLPPILVAPNGNYTDAAFGDSEWLNSADGANKFEDFIVSQVVPWIDHNYRTIPAANSRVIAGVSEGGYGAVNIALHNPQIFGNVIALSGYYNNDGSGWARKSMGHNKDFLAYNSPLSYLTSPAAQAKMLSIWQTQHYFIGSGLDENRYTIESSELVDAMHAHGISADLCQVDGKHSWTLWSNLFVAGIANIFSPVNNTSAPDITPSKIRPI